VGGGRKRIGRDAKSVYLVVSGDGGRGNFINHILEKDPQGKATKKARGAAEGEGVAMQGNYVAGLLSAREAERGASL